MSTVGVFRKELAQLGRVTGANGIGFPSWCQGQGVLREQGSPCLTLWQSGTALW